MIYNNLKYYVFSGQPSKPQMADIYRRVFSYWWSNWETVFSELNSEKNLDPFEFFSQSKVTALVTPDEVVAVHLLNKFNIRDFDHSTYLKSYSQDFRDHLADTGVKNFQSMQFWHVNQEARTSREGAKLAAVSLGLSFKHQLHDSLDASITIARTDNASSSTAKKFGMKCFGDNRELHNVPVAEMICTEPSVYPKEDISQLVESLWADRIDLVSTDMPIEEAFEKEIRKLATSLLNYPLEDKEMLLKWMNQQYYIVQNSTRYLAQSASRTPLGNQSDFNHWVEHIAGEKGHDRMLFNDMKFLGHNGADSQLPETHALIAFQYSDIESNGPCALYGYALLLEGLSLVVCDEMATRIERKFGVRAATYLRLHAKVDLEHYPHGIKEVKELDFDTQKMILNNLRASSSLYLSMMDGIAKVSQRQESISLDKFADHHADNSLQSLLFS